MAAASGRPRAPRRWLRTVWRVSILGICVAAIVALPRFLPQNKLPVRVAQVTIGSVRDVVSSATAGEVTPEKRATVRAEHGGQVITVKFRRGDRVKKGDLVVQLDPADLNARLRQSAAAFDAAEAQRRQAATHLDGLKRQADRAKHLADTGAGTLQVSEDTAAAVAEAQQSVQVALSQRAQSTASYQAARVARAHATVLAPFDGVLTEVSVDPGESLPLGAPIFQIIDDARLHVDATVDEADAAKLRPGQPAELHLDALPDHTVRGAVSRVDPVVKRDIKGARTLTVEVEVTGADKARAAGLKPGMSANVEIVVAEKTSVVSVPSNVIVGRGVSRFVYVVEPDGPETLKVHKRPVQVGISNWERTEITSGLRAGETVVTSLNEKGLDDGVVVQVQKTEAAGAEPAR